MPRVPSHHKVSAYALLSVYNAVLCFLVSASSAILTPIRVLGLTTWLFFFSKLSRGGPFLVCFAVCLPR